MVESTPALPFRHDFGAGDDHIGEQFRRFQTLKASDFPAAVKCFMAFKIAILRRIAWEEAEIFPSFLRRVGAALENTVAALRQEHSEVVKLLEAIEAKLNRSDPSTEAEEVALQKLLSAHNHQEHRVIFPAFE